MIRSLCRRAGKLRKDEGGLALLEFALALPVVLFCGGYGIEISNYALVQLNISQYALNLADNASRVGVVSSNGVSTLRETDINDVLQATKIQGDSINLTTYGRITLSSLENVAQDYDKTTTQRIHWQRCIGLKSGSGYDSSYGTALTTAGAAAPDNYTASANDQYAGVATPGGMGDAGSQVTAPADTGVMFVEINYDYQPFFGTLFIAPSKIHYIASFVVRDNRDFTQITNPAPTATASTCNLYTAGPATINKY
ncbi:histidine kinase [Nostoc sp. 3335mG]|nr:histidine kinase [Nostoc sp. 3335mG]